MPQTSYTDAPVKAYEGAVADQGKKDLISKTTSDAVTYGRFVCNDEVLGDAYCRLPAASGDIGGVTFGVAVAKTSSDSAGYAEYDSVSILNKGRVWMIAEDAVSAGDAVYVRYTANGAGKVVGQVRSDGDSSKAAALSRAKFASSAGAGDLVLVELN